MDKLVRRCLLKELPFDQHFVLDKQKFRQSMRVKDPEKRDVIFCIARMDGPNIKMSGCTVVKPVIKYKDFSGQ